ncbi:MAG: universal stress protein [Myxococcales bacterium]|nr:universal stress protein [Myxococcales bacterium]
MAKGKSIVVGVDFSEVSNRALSYALELAEGLHARVTVVHAYSLNAFNLPIEGAIISTAAQATQISEALQEKLDALLARHQDAKVELHGSLRLGQAYEEVIAVAEEQDAELIVIGTHGRRGAAHALMGSVAERIVRMAERPVLTIPASATG